MQRSDLSARARAALDTWVRPGLTNTPLPPDPTGIWRVVQANEAEVRVASDDGGSASMRITFGTVSDVQVGTPTWAGGSGMVIGPAMPPPRVQAPVQPVSSAAVPAAALPVSSAAVPAAVLPRSSAAVPAAVLPRSSSAVPAAALRPDTRILQAGWGPDAAQAHTVQYRVGGADLVGQPPGDIPVPPPIRPSLAQAPDLEDWVEQVANRARPQPDARPQADDLSALSQLFGETREARDERLARKAVLEAESTAVGKTMLRFGGVLVVAWMALPDPWGLLGFVGLMLLVVWGVKKSGRLSQEIRQLSHAPGPAGTMGADAPSREVQLGMDVPSGDR